MSTVRATSDAERLTGVQWLIVIIAAIGFAFDSYELLMLPLIVRPALAELLQVQGNSLAVNEWVGYMQYVPAVAMRPPIDPTVCVYPTIASRCFGFGNSSDSHATAATNSTQTPTNVQQRQNSSQPTDVEKPAANAESA